MLKIVALDTLNSFMMSGIALPAWRAATMSCLLVIVLLKSASESKIIVVFI